MRTLLALVIGLCFCLADLSAQQRGTVYGEQPVGTAEPLRVVARRGDVGKTVVVTGRVVDVCKKKGCWMMVVDGPVKIRVTFKDYGFFVPVKLKGTSVTMTGVLTEEVTTEAERRHYAEDAGMSKKAVRRIKGDKRELTFEAAGVRVN